MPEFEFELTPDEVSLITSRMSLTQGAVYCDGTLTVSDVAMAGEIEALVSVEGWQSSMAPTLPELKSERITALTAECAAAIIGGYMSSALGAPHIYPSKQTDQLNMMGSVTDSLLPGLSTSWSTPFWCADEAGEWAYRAHNVEQIRQAGSEGKTHVVLCQTLLATLTAAIDAAETAEAVAAIVWPNS